MIESPRDLVSFSCPLEQRETRRKVKFESKRRGVKVIFINSKKITLLHIYLLLKKELKVIFERRK